MAAFKASPEKRGVAAPTADEAGRNPPLAVARGAARSAPAHGTPGGGTAARGQQEARSSYLTGTASREPITESRFVWIDRRFALAHGRAVEGETPRNRTRRDCRDDQPHDRREDLSEGPRACGRLTERESFFEEQA